MIEHLQKLAPEIVERFLDTRQAEPLGIPAQLANYILQINEAANLHRRYHSITECARQLQKLYPELSIHTCKSRIYDSINYLNADSNVTAEAWNVYYADMFMKLFEVNLVAHNFREAKNCLKLSREYRIAASANAIDPERLKFKHQIVSADMQLERMGVKQNGLLAAYKQGLSIIENLDVNETEKKRMIEEVKAELNITDGEYEEI
jgi:hypothetical protein